MRLLNACSTVALLTGEYTKQSGNPLLTVLSLQNDVDSAIQRDASAGLRARPCPERPFAFDVARWRVPDIIASAGGDRGGGPRARVVRTYHR